MNNKKQSYVCHFKICVNVDILNYFRYLFVLDLKKKKKQKPRVLGRDI